MSAATVAAPTFGQTDQARINADNNELMQVHTAALLDDPDALPPDPITVFLPIADPIGLVEALTLAWTYTRDGYDVDLRHVHVHGRRPR